MRRTVALVSAARSATLSLGLSLTALWWCGDALRSRPRPARFVCPSVFVIGESTGSILCGSLCGVPSHLRPVLLRFGRGREWCYGLRFPAARAIEILVQREEREGFELAECASQLLLY